MSRHRIALDCGHEVNEPFGSRGGQAVRGKLWPCDVCHDRTLVVKVDKTIVADDKRRR